MPLPPNYPIYPGRLNPRELRQKREEEIYEAIMTDLCLMGILSEDQFKQYNHRYINELIHPKQPILNAFPGLVPNYYDPAQYAGKQLVVDAEGNVVPDVVNELYVQEWASVAGIFAIVQQSATAQPVPPAGITPANNDICFVLSYSTKWIVNQWRYNGTAWSVVDTVDAANFHWVAVKDGDDVSGYYVLLTGSASTDLATWQSLTPQVVILPDEWVDVPVDFTQAYTEVVLEQVNLKTGQKRQKLNADGDALFTMILKGTVGITADSSTFYPIDPDEKLTVAGGVVLDKSSGVAILGTNLQAALPLTAPETLLVSLPVQAEVFNEAPTGLALFVDSHSTALQSFDYSVIVEYHKV